jgi:hypothetical protein
MNILVERHRDAKLLNQIVNDPAVRPDVAPGTAEIDMSASVADTNNVTLLGEHGGCVFFKIQYGVYEVHTQATKPGRGNWIAHVAESCLDYMFTATDCYEVTTRIPRNHAAARGLAVHVGMRFEFEREDGCEWRGQKQHVEIYSLRMQDFLPGSNTFDERGEEFHEFLHGEAKRIGITDPPHANDPNHNRYLGQALEMIMHGYTLKGVGWYNRWAVTARHRTVTLVSETPLLIRMDIGILRIDRETGDMSIEREH